MDTLTIVKENKNGDHIINFFVKLLKLFQRQHFSNRLKMSREKIVYARPAVRGFHFFKSIWTPSESEVLSCEYEETNPYDIFAIKTCQENGRIVGHLPMEISRITKYLLDRGARIDAKLSETNYRRSPLVQGGLQTPCTLIIRMAEEPQEVVVLGTFNTNTNLNNQPNQTT